MSATEALKRILGITGDRKASLAVAKDRLERHLARPIKSHDPAEHGKWRAEGERLKGDIADLEAALRDAEEDERQTRAKVRDDEERAKVSEFLREKKAVHTSLLRVFALSAEIEKLMPGIVEHVRKGPEVARLAAKLRMPPVTDAERDLREVPGRIEPAQFEMREEWVGAKMDSPVHLHIHADGKTASSPHGTYHLKKVRVQTSPERKVPACMPPRLADAIKLVDAAGNVIWPPHR